MQNDNYSETVTAAWNELKSKVERFCEIDKLLEAVVVEKGFKDLRSYFVARESIISRLSPGKNISRNRRRYRRRTSEDITRVLEMVKNGERTKHIAQKLGLAPGTVSNIKRKLRDEGKL